MKKGTYYKVELITDDDITSQIIGRENREDRILDRFEAYGMIISKNDSDTIKLKICNRYLPHLPYSNKHPYESEIIFDKRELFNIVKLLLEFNLYKHE